MDFGAPHVSIEPEGAGFVVRLRGELTVEFSATIREAILGAFAKPGAVTVDISGLSYADLSFFQLLCSAHRKAAKEDRELSVRGYTERAVQGLIDEIGFARNSACIAGKEVDCLWKVR